MGRAYLAISLCASALQQGLCTSQTWFDQKQHPGAMGDFLPSERDEIRSEDPGIEGGPRAVGAADLHYGELIRQHGDQVSDNMFIVENADWERRSGTRIINATPFNVSGSMVLRTDHGFVPSPLMYGQVGWTVAERPRRMALMVIEMIEDYRPYLGYLVPKIKPLLYEFREQGLPVFFTNWARRPGDGLYGALDRANGYKGVSSGTNFQYTYKDGGLLPMMELAPTRQEVRLGHFIKSIHLDKFADLDVHGNSRLSELVRSYGVDTLVLTGGWTDACIVATALDAMDTKNLDVLVVSDAVGTATPNQQGILRTFSMMFAQQKSNEFLQYLRKHDGDMSYILPPAKPSEQLVAKYAVESTGNDLHPMRPGGDLQAPLALIALALVGLTCSFAAVVRPRSESVDDSTCEAQPVLLQV